MPQTPPFWYQPVGLQARVLQPLSWAYAAAAAMHRAWARPKKVSVPVIAVGNLVAGGGGKTPTTLWLARALQQQGHNPHILSRGYGRRSTALLRVNPQHHSAAEVGDEPLLLARQAPTWVGRSRYNSAQCAIKEGATHLILDDGLQHYTLQKDAQILCLQGAMPLGNGLCLPAGPLRQKLQSLRPPADIVLSIGADTPPITLPGAMHFSARVYPRVALPQARLFAFAGIAQPERFFMMLRHLGAQLTGTCTFADHHFYRDYELEGLSKDAELRGAKLITTAKDAVRLPPEFCKNVTVMDVTLGVIEADLLLQQLFAVLAAKQH